MISGILFLFAMSCKIARVLNNYFLDFARVLFSSFLLIFCYDMAENSKEQIREFK